jgi:hypothetical protein
MKTFMTFIRSRVWLIVCAMLGVYGWINAVYINPMYHAEETLSKAIIIGLGVLCNGLALWLNRRVWVGLMAPLYFFGLIRGMFWMDAQDVNQFDPTILLVMVLMTLLPITYFMTPSRKQTKG